MNHSEKAIATPRLANPDGLILARANRALAHLPGPAPQFSTAKSAVVNPDGQQEIRIVANKSLNVAQLTSSAAGKAVAVFNMGEVRQLA